MAEVVHFEQDPDAPAGAGVFHFDAGEPMYGYEPELAAKVGKLKGAIDAAPDQRLAKNDAGAQRHNPFDRSLADFRAQPDQNLEQLRADVNPQSIVDQNNAAVAGAVAAAAPPPPPPGPQEMASAARDAMGQRAAEDILRGTKRVYQPGTPGVDPNKMRAQGVMVPTTASETFESQNALPYSPEAARERLGASHMVQQATLADMELSRQQTANQLASQRALAPKLEAAAADAQNKQNAVNAAYRTDRARLQQDLDHYEKTAHVDPARFFQDRGIFATIGLAIAQGLGAYASTMTGAPNFAYEMTQKAIDRDIAAQRDEIEAGRVSRRNAMAQMMDNYGFDMQQAEAATRLAMTKSAEMQAQMFANESKLPHYQTEAAKYLALTNQDNIKNEQALQAASIGKHTQTIQNAFVQPKAATGGGYVEKPLTPEEYAARAKNLPQQQGGDWQELKPEQRVDAVKGYGTKKQEFADSRAALSDLADAYGLRVDWKNGTVVDKDGKPVNADEFTLTGSREDIPGVGRPSLSIQAAHRVKEARSKAAAQTGKALSGASVSPQQAEYINSYLLGEDDAAAVRGLQRAVGSMNDVERDTDATFPDEARREYERRSRSVNHERKSAPPPVKVSEY